MLLARFMSAMMTHQPTPGTSVTLIACGSFNPPTYMHLRMFEVARDYIERTLHCHVSEGIISPTNDSYAKPGLANAKHRCKMLELALRSSDWVHVDPWESEQTSWIPTLFVMRHHREQLQRKLSAVSGNNLQPNDLPKPSSTTSAPTAGSESSITSSPGSILSYSTDGSASQPNPAGNSQPPRLMLLCGGDLLNSFFTPNLWLEEHITEILRDYGLCVLNRAGVDIWSKIHESQLLSTYASNIHLIDDRANPNECSSTRIRAAIRSGQSIKYLVDDGVDVYIKQHGLYQAGPDNQSPLPSTLATPYGPLARQLGSRQIGSSFDSAVSGSLSHDPDLADECGDTIKPYDMKHYDVKHYDALRGISQSAVSTKRAQPMSDALNWAPPSLIRASPHAGISPRHNSQPTNEIICSSDRSIIGNRYRSRSAVRPHAINRIRRSRTENSQLYSPTRDAPAPSESKTSTTSTFSEDDLLVDLASNLEQLAAESGQRSCASFPLLLSIGEPLHPTNASGVRSPRCRTHEPKDHQPMFQCASVHDDHSAYDRRNLANTKIQLANASSHPSLLQLPSSELGRSRQASPTVLLPGGMKKVSSTSKPSVPPKPARTRFRLPGDDEDEEEVIPTETTV